MSEPQYRILKVGEVIQEGDECNIGEWYPARLQGSCVEDGAYRRKIQPTQPMTTNNDGGPASEKTLRDEFAIAAMSLCSLDLDQLEIKRAASEIGVSVSDYEPSVHYPQLLAKRTYTIADAMLAARQTKGEK